MKFSHDWMSDTHPEALRVYLDIQRRLSPEAKLARVAELYEAITAFQTEEVRRLIQRPPNAKYFSALPHGVSDRS